MNRRNAQNRRADAARGAERAPARPRLGLRAWREQHLYSLFSSLGRLAARPWATALTVLVMGLALALPALAYLAFDNARQLGGRVDEARDISVFLKLGLDSTQIESAAQRWRHRGDVAAVAIKTPAQGLDEFRSQSGFADALRVLQYNPLPAVAIVTPSVGVVAQAQESSLIAELQHDADVDLVQYDAQWRRRLSAILGVGERAVGVLAALLALATLLVVGNTVRLDIQGRSEEIAVMQLLGASNGFVRRPFLYTGLWYGTLSGSVALVLVLMVQAALAGPIARLTHSYDQHIGVHGVSFSLALGVLLASAAFGWFGAWLVVSRHLAVGQPR